MPVPERLTDWGLPVASSVKVMTATRAPVTAGLNVTLIVQLAFTATELPQLFDWEKSLAAAPESAMLVMFKTALPVLVSVIAWAALVLLTG